MKICLVCDDPVVEWAVRACCPKAGEIAVLPGRGIVDAANRLSPHGASIAETAATSDVLLIEWSFADAPAINTLCFRVRSRLAGPVIALCRGGSEDTVAAVAAGADEAVGFPIVYSALQARVLSYRRLVQAVRDAGPSAESGPATAGDRDVIGFGELRLDLTAHRFFIRDHQVELTPREFTLISYLMTRTDQLCTRDQILDAVWGIRFDTGTNMVDVYMHFIRKKLEVHGLKDMVETVRGHGYRFVLPPDTGSTDLR